MVSNFRGAPLHPDVQTLKGHYYIPQVISYSGVAGGDEQGEPLDYFAYYDQEIVVPDRQGKGRGKMPEKEGDAAKTDGKEEEKISPKEKKNESETNGGKGIVAVCECV